MTVVQLNCSIESQKEKLAQNIINIFDLCYNEILQCTVIFALVSAAAATFPKGIPEAKCKPGYTPKKGSKNLGLCESDCDEDKDCMPGLWCADAHGIELRRKGLDQRKANCYNVIIPDKYEVCFNPNILSSGGAGGGKLPVIILNEYISWNRTYHSNMIQSICLSSPPQFLSSYADPHFRTYDGTKYTFHGECDLVMAHSQLDDQNEMDIHARTKMVDNWSLISNAALRIGDDIFEVDNDEFAHYFNGAKNVEFPILLGGKYEVTSHEQMTSSKNEKGEEITAKEIIYTIDLVNKGSITITNYHTMLSIKVDSYLVDTYGMLGSRTTDGLFGRDGVTSVSEEEMGAQWQVRDTESMLFHELGTGPQYPESCLMTSVNSRQRRLRTSDVSYDTAKKACENVDDSMRAFCIEDVVRSGDVSMAHTYTASAW